MNYSSEVADFLAKDKRLEETRIDLVSRIRYDVDTMVIPEIRNGLPSDCRIGQYATIIAAHKGGAVVQIQLVGGGLVDARGERVREVSQLLEPTTTRLKDQYGLAGIEFLRFGSDD